MSGDIRGKKPHILPPLKGSTSPRGLPIGGDNSPLSPRRPPADLSPMEAGLGGGEEPLRSPARLPRRHKAGLKSLSSPGRSLPLEEEDFRTLSIGSPVPCSAGSGELESAGEGREGEGSAFPSITVDKCEEQMLGELPDRPGPLGKPLSSSMEEADLSAVHGSPPGLPYRRSISIQDSLTRDTPVSGSGSSLLTPTPPVFRKQAGSSRVLQYYSNHSSLPPSRSDGDILATATHVDQHFQALDRHHPRFKIDVDRPPTPWKAPPEAPPGGAGPLSPLATPRRATSPCHSPLTPRKPVRLVPLQYSRENKCSPSEADEMRE